MNKRKKIFSSVVFAFTLMFALASGVGYTSRASEILAEEPVTESEPTTDESKTEPSTGESEPSTDESEPSTDESEPSTDESEPSTDESEPSTDESEPSTDESEPSTDESEPSTDESEPSTDESEPSTDESEAPKEEYISITTAEELKAIASNAGGKYILMNDIDLSQTAWTSITSFSGILNGNGHTIKGLNAPLIDSMSGGSIYNLTLSDVNISVSGSAGALAKTLSNSSAEKCVITNISVTGTITGTDAVGGLVGIVNVEDNQLEISSCYNQASITGVNEVGGIAGRLVCGSSAAAAAVDVKGAANSGTVKGTSKIGGIIGYVSLADAVSGYDAHISLTESYNVGAIDCTNTYAGGLAGYVEVSGMASAAQAVKIENCYNLGHMKDGGNIAGGVGIASGSVYISKCIGVQIYNSKTLGMIDTAAAINGGTAGVCTLADCYYFSATDEYAYTTGSKVSGTANALNATQIKTAASFVNFDFTNVWAISSTVNNGYPYLKALTVMPVVNAAPAAGTTLADSATAGSYKVLTPGCTVSYLGTTNTSATTVTIPSEVVIDGYTYEVTEIAVRAFYNNKNITTITVPATVTTIRRAAFYGCTSLKKVGGCAGVQRILMNAFRGCSSLTTVGGTTNRITLKSVTSLGARAFMNCTSIKRVYISSTNLTTIGMGAFRNCKAMTRITTFSTGISKIGQYAFYKDANLKMIILRTTGLTASSVGNKAFTGIYAKARFKVPSANMASYKAIFKSKGAGSKIIMRAI